jgi:RNA polymerase sigma-70 factor (ECF subfamily)
MAESGSSGAPKATDSFDIQEFVELHGDRLLRSAYLLCGSTTEAQDLAQETLVQAIKSWRHFRADSALYTWVHGILLNLCRHYHRKQKRLVYDDELLREESISDDAVPNSDQDFCAATLTQAIQALSLQHREVIVLRYYDNLKIHEIARQTGVSSGTVKSRLHYAVRHLEHLLPREMNHFASEGTNNKELP